MASFLRIGGDEVDLGGGRIVWRPGTAGDADGIAFALTAHGGPHLLHVTGWLPGSEPADLSCSELLLDVPGPDAALDGRIFAMALVRFGRVTERRAVVSLDGEIEGIEADSDARTTVAADIVCGVERAHEPAFCGACGRALGEIGAERHEFAGGRFVTTRHASTTCTGCVEALRGRPPAFCTACGVAYEADRHAAPGRRAVARLHVHVPGRAHRVRHQRRLGLRRRAAECPLRWLPGPDPSRTPCTRVAPRSARTRTRSRGDRDRRGCRPSPG